MLNNNCTNWKVCTEHHCMIKRNTEFAIGFVLLMAIGFNQVAAQGFEGYYQHPDIHQNTIVFVAEGDIWKVSIEGGLLCA